jgi:hypothetical protein
VLTAAFLVVMFRRFTRASAAEPMEALPVTPVAAGAEKRYGAALDDELRDLD